MNEKYVNHEKLMDFLLKEYYNLCKRRFLLLIGGYSRGSLEETVGIIKSKEEVIIIKKTEKYADFSILYGFDGEIKC